MKKIIAILSSITFIASIVAGVIFIEERYASAKDLKLVAMRLEQKIQQDRSHVLQERLWSIEDRYINKKMPEEIKKQYRYLKEEFNNIEKTIEKIISEV